METYAAVDLARLERNLTAIRAIVNRPILLPVKANAYGHGLTQPGQGQALSAPLAQFVAGRGLVDWFGVASVSEGLALRAAGIGLPILKFSPAPADEVGQAVAAGLTLTVLDLDTIDQADRAAGALGKRADVHLKIDTGMRRIGAFPADVPRLAARIEASAHLNLTGVFTHLAVSEDPSQDDFTASQIAQFDRAVAEAQDELGRLIGLKHAANSGAVLRHPEAWYDLVRPGILSYGYAHESQAGPTSDDGAESPVPVEPVLSLVSHVSFVKTVQAGDTVSYGRTWTAPRDSRLATVPIGYGDGYSRRLSNQVSVLIRGRRCPQVGRVCMDQIMVDLGPDSTVGVGEQVTLIGADGDERIGADELGALSGTISYEVLCNIAARVPRVYVNGGQ